MTNDCRANSCLYQLSVGTYYHCVHRRVFSASFFLASLCHGTQIRSLWPLLVQKSKKEGLAVEKGLKSFTQKNK